MQNQVVWLHNPWFHYYTMQNNTMYCLGKVTYGGMGGKAIIGKEAPYVKIFRKINPQIFASTTDSLYVHT